MKRTLLLLAALLVMLPATAQLKTTGAFQAPKDLGTFRTGILSVTQSENGIILWITTNNRYDPRGCFILGNTKESAIQTADDLLAFMDGNEPGTMLTAESEPGKECLLTLRSTLGVKVLYFDFAGFSGTQSLTHKELEKIRDTIEKKAN